MQDRLILAPREQLRIPCTLSDLVAFHRRKYRRRWREAATAYPDCLGEYARNILRDLGMWLDYIGYVLDVVDDEPRVLPFWICVAEAAWRIKQPVGTEEYWLRCFHRAVKAARLVSCCAPTG